MKRLDENKTILIPPVRLYFDDVEQILVLLQKDMSVELECQNYSYDSLDELKSNIQIDCINNLLIRASGNDNCFSRLDITINQGEVRLDSDSQAAERKSHISEMLRSKVRWYSWKPMKAWWWGLRGMIAFLYPFLIISTIGMFFPLPTVADYFLSFLIITGCFIIFFSDRVWLGGSKIYLYTKFGKPTFWQRNRDTILIGIILSLVSALIGYIVGSLSSGA